MLSFLLKMFNRLSGEFRMEWHNRLASFANLREDIGFGKYKEKAINHSIFQVY